MSERMAKMEAQLDYLVEAEKKRDEACERHSRWVKSISDRVDVLDTFKTQAEASGATVVNVGKLTIFIGTVAYGLWEAGKALIAHLAHRG